MISLRDGKEFLTFESSHFFWKQMIIFFLVLPDFDQVENICSRALFEIRLVSLSKMQSYNIASF